MNKFIALLAVLASFSASAEWRSREISTWDKDFYATIYQDAQGYPSVGVVIKDNTCIAFSGETTFEPAVKVNGTWVKQSHQCVGSNKALLFPSTVGGSDYMVEQFKKSLTVVVETQTGNEYKFAAGGFTKAYNSTLNSKDIEDKAL